MKSKEQLAQELENKSGWKKISTSLLGKLQAGKYFKRYIESDDKGVADLVRLRKEQYDDSHYAVVAFSRKGALTNEQIEILKERVNQFPINSIRYEATGNGGFYPTVNDAGEYFNEEYQIHRLGEDMDGVQVTVFSVFKEEKLDCPYIIYAHNKDMLYVYYVDRRFL